MDFRTPIFNSIARQHSQEPRRVRCEVSGAILRASDESCRGDRPDDRAACSMLRRRILIGLNLVQTGYGLRLKFTGLLSVNIRRSIDRKYP
jgi:hypothetical protein